MHRAEAFLANYLAEANVYEIASANLLNALYIITVLHAAVLLYTSLWAS